jgi:predicted nucleotidyltransferase
MGKQRIEVDYSGVKTFPEGGREFINQLAAKLDPDLVESILLFGSSVSGGTTEVSDIDLIVVVSDTAPEAYQDSVRSICNDLSREYLSTEASSSSQIEQWINRWTGMFQTGFVSSREEIESGCFSEIFDTPNFVYYIAPWRTVLASVFDNVQSLYGPKIQPDWDSLGYPRDHLYQELIRSFLMNISLATIQIPYSFISSNAALYSQESYKWTIYNCSYYINKKPARSLGEALSTIPSFFSCHERFEQLRNEPKNDYKFVVLCPLCVMLIFIWSIVNCNR